MITKTDGTEIKGELIGLKQNSTLLLESSSRIGGSIDVSEVKIIKTVKGAYTGTGFLSGLFVGGATGAAIGYGIGSYQSSSGLLGNYSEVVGAEAGAIIGGLAGSFLGAVIGSSTHKYETFQIEGKSQEQIKAFLEKLRTQARFPEYQ